MIVSNVLPQNKAKFYGIDHQNNKSNEWNILATVNIHAV